ncbi:MAG TPA: hypothetical protein VLG11_03980 [Candidatus Saccharimonadales bacterium]|nr:hypothetical protein [Candidatus Saccharimonadales bacterium]
MKSVHLPNLEPLPSLSAPMPQPLIGEAAVLEAEAAMEDWILSDRAHELQIAIEQLRTMPHDQRIKLLGEQSTGAALRSSSSQADRARLVSWLGSAEPSDYKELAWAYEGDAARLRSDARGKEIEALAQVMETRGRLASDYGAHHKEKIDTYLESEAPLIFHDWKARAEANNGHELTWSEWLVRDAGLVVVPPEIALGATDPQLLNVLQWNADRVRRLNADPEVQRELEAYRIRTEQALTTAVANGQLSPALLERFQHKQGETPIFIGDVFDPILSTANGYRSTSLGHIVLGKIGDFKLTVHERLHGMGGFANAFLNEGMTDIYTKVVMNADAALQGEEALRPSEYSYASHAAALDDILALAQITGAESSQIYAGSSQVQNTARLQALVKERVGADFLGYTLDFYAFKLNTLCDDAVRKAMEAANGDISAIVLDKANLARITMFEAADLTSGETLSVWKEMAATRAPAKDIIERKIEALRQQQEASSAAS